MPIIKKRLSMGFCFLFVMLGSQTFAAELYVDLNSTNAIAPYLSWETAARTIQSAIDVATNGDVVWVTNGVYVGGAVNVNKTIAVRSVNGPASTTIDALAATNCASLVDGRCSRVLPLPVELPREPRESSVAQPQNPEL